MCRVVFLVASKWHRLPCDLCSLRCSLIMFYFIALAGAHKRVVDQLREQLSLVRKDTGPAGHGWGHLARTPNGKWYFSQECRSAP